MNLFKIIILFLNFETILGYQCNLRNCKRCSKIESDSYRDIMSDINPRLIRTYRALSDGCDLIT